MLETLMKLLVTEPDSFGKNFYPKNGLKIGFLGKLIENVFAGDGQKWMKPFGS